MLSEPPTELLRDYAGHVWYDELLVADVKSFHVKDGGLEGIYLLHRSPLVDSYVIDRSLIPDRIPLQADGKDGLEISVPWETLERALGDAGLLTSGDSELHLGKLRPRRERPHVGHELAQLELAALIHALRAFDAPLTVQAHWVQERSPESTARIDFGRRLTADESQRWAAIKQRCRWSFIVRGAGFFADLRLAMRDDGVEIAR